jgi:RNA polymerase sigma-70 factor (ECF subfamily)
MNFGSKGATAIDVLQSRIGRHDTPRAEAASTAGAAPAWCDTFALPPYIATMDGVRLLELLAPSAPVAIEWEDVYRRELPRVYGYLRWRVRDRVTAEDLTSLVFEKAWRARGRYRRDRAAVGTWLLRIARNAATDHLRRPTPKLAPLEEGTLGHDATPEADVVRAEQRERLRALVAALPERQRELLALKHGADVTNRAIARLTGLRESNVGTILHRTVLSLRAAWDQGGRS